MACSAHMRTDIAHSQKTEDDRPHGFCVQAVGFVEFPDIIHWQEKWADTALHGYRPGRRAEHVWMDLAVRGICSG